MNFGAFLQDYADPAVLAFLVCFLISFLVTLYSIQLINRRLRLLHGELAQLNEDNQLLNESIQFLQDQLSGIDDVNEEESSEEPAQAASVL